MKKLIISCHKHMDTYKHYVLILLFLFSLLGLRVAFAQMLPTEALELNSTNITQAPFNCLPEATVCDLSNKGIVTIAPNTFIAHTQLQYLYLHSNQISSLQKSSFSGLINLLYLSLSHNQITNISADTFSLIPKLLDLNLSYNPVVTVAPTVLDSLDYLRSANFANQCIYNGGVLYGGYLSCNDPTYQDKQSCEAAGYCYNNTYGDMSLYHNKSTCEAVGFCDNSSLKTQASCEGAGSCMYAPSLTTKAACESTFWCYGFPSFTTQETCEGAGSCTDGISKTKQTCDAGWYCNEDRSLKTQQACLTAGFCNGNASLKTKATCEAVGSCQGNASLKTKVSCEGAGFCTDGVSQDQVSCEGAGSCTDGSSPDKVSCEGAGFCSNYNYGDQVSCEAAGWYCDDGVSQDQQSCEAAGRCSDGISQDQVNCETIGYCEDWSSPDQQTCADNGYNWTMGVRYPYNWIQSVWGYYGNAWIPYQRYSYGYSWMDNNRTDYMYHWEQNIRTPTVHLWEAHQRSSNGYTWSPNVWNTYGYTWEKQRSSWSTYLDKNYCASVDSLDVPSYLANLSALGGGNIFDDYYFTTSAISFDQGITNTILANTDMQSLNGYTQGGSSPLALVDVLFPAGTAITTDNGQAFTGVLHTPVLFATGNVPELPGVLSFVRFGAFTQAISFSQSVTVNIPVLGRHIGDIVTVYTADKESLYDGAGAQWVSEKVLPVVSIGGVPYIQLKTTHAGWFAVIEGGFLDQTAPVATLTYSPDNAGTTTSGDVLVSLSLDETGIVTNNGGSVTHLFTGNGDFVFEFEDSSGNTGSIKSSVNWIDKTVPVVVDTGTVNTGTTSTGNISTGVILTGSTNTGNLNTGTIVTGGVVTPPEVVSTTNSASRNGGGISLRKDVCPKGDASASYYDGICTSSLQQNQIYTRVTQPLEYLHGVAPVDTCSVYSNELQDAYVFSYENGITTSESCEAAKLEAPLLRSHLAKMISQFAVRVLKMQPNTGLDCVFSDEAYMPKETAFYAHLACQLGVMGYHPDGRTELSAFSPYGEVTRAQFGTALSRLLWNTRYAGGTPYYTRHLKALQDASIMKKIDVPEQIEHRGNVMIMLMRSQNQNN